MKNFLQHLGHYLKEAFTIGEEAATVAAPIVAREVPSVGPLFNACVAEAAKAQATIGDAPGTGAAKLLAASSALLPQAQEFAAANGIPVPADASGWVSALQSAIVEAVKLIPAPSAAVPADPTGGVDMGDSAPAPSVTV